MKLRFVILSLLVFCSTAAYAGVEGVYGKGTTLTEVTPVSTIYAAPQKYVGKRVLVEGMILEVCAARGCWIYLSSDRPFEKIRVKVTDGEIVFPMEARGKVATVEGVVESMVLTREEVIKRRKHHAEEKGVAFDPASVTSGETILRIRGLGASIDGV